MKITDFKIVYICPDHNEKYQIRKLHMDKLCREIGFQEFYHFKSSSDEYPLCLNKAIIEILKNNLDNPVIILEDDVEFTGEFECEISEGVDAIYLGISKDGGHPTENSHNGPSIYKAFNNSQVQILNMLSGHAILYLSRRYKEAVINILENHLKRHTVTYNPDGMLLRRYPIDPYLRIKLGYTKIIDKGYWYNDVLFTRLQSSFLVLANKKPSFYQSNKFNTHDLESKTKFTIHH